MMACLDSELINESVAYRTCSTAWMPQDEASHFKDVFIPSCINVLASLASRLQKKYSNVSPVILPKIYL